MISNQVLQTTIDGLKNITRIDICVMDTEGKALATTINNVEEYEEAVMGFGSVSDKDTSLFKMISRDDLVKFGALYELVGRFPYIINFSPLTEEAVKGVISKIRKKLEDEYECRITLTPGMEESLLKEANSPYGCRIFESMLREGASHGLLKWYEEEMNEPGTHPVITINSMDEVYVEKFEQEEVESNCTE